MISLSFIFSGPYDTNTAREKCYCSASVSDFIQPHREAIGVRILNEDLELSPILDADIFVEYYDIAIKHINAMIKE